jgi:hypothetical protein
MKKLSDFQPRNVPRASISEGISIDADENSLSENSASQNSLDDESMDDSAATSSHKPDQVTVRVSDQLLLIGSIHSNPVCFIQFAIKEVRDLPQCDGDSVMCRYTFINQKDDQRIFSVKSSSSNNGNNDEETEKKPRTFSFNHEKVSSELH